MASPPTPNDPTPADRRAERWEQAKASAVGLQLGVSVALGALAGHWVDDQLGSGPKGLTAGVVLGAAAGFRELYRLAKRTMR